jgi:hypothetical protein
MSPAAAEPAEAPAEETGGDQEKEMLMKLLGGVA